MLLWKFLHTLDKQSFKQQVPNARMVANPAYGESSNSGAKENPPLYDIIQNEI